MKLSYPFHWSKSSYRVSAPCKHRIMMDFRQQYVTFTSNRCATTCRDKFFTDVVRLQYAFVIIFVYIIYVDHDVTWTDSIPIPIYFDKFFGWTLIQYTCRPQKFKQESVLSIITPLPQRLLLFLYPFITNKNTIYMFIFSFISSGGSNPAEFLVCVTT